MEKTGRIRRRGDEVRLPVLILLFFFSGFAALIYQVLWMRQLGLLLGSTAQAAALTSAIFFAGLGLGGWFWGRRAARARSGLLLFGFLEIGVGLTALGFFSLFGAYYGLYPRLFAVGGNFPGAVLLLKALTAVTILLLPAFLMGGTLPAMGEYAVADPRQLGRKGSLLYAINTAGGALGALAAGFYLSFRLGIRNSYLLAVAVDIGIGLVALRLARRPRTESPRPRRIARPPRALPPAPVGAPAPSPLIWLTAFVSGAAVLGVEVIWTRLFSQVLQNSVYTYSLVLVTFLFALALGAGLANRLGRRRRFGDGTILAVLLALSGVAVACSPWWFYGGAGLDQLGRGRDWWPYLGSVARVAAAVMLVPGVIIGAVFPFLFRMFQDSKHSPGRVVGNLLAVNTAGAIFGALAAGFVIVPLLGASRGLLLPASLYIILFGLILAAPGGFRRRSGAVLICLSALALPLIPPRCLPAVIQVAADGERLVEVIEGSQATVAVVERGGGLLLRANNDYTLGSSNAFESERNQALIPMMLHPEPRRVFFLGMGTGITAGAALYFPVVELVVCELLPEAVELARRHFSPWTEGLFDDPRVRILADDGRHRLRMDPAVYDLIISDLFTPWKAGSGNLYTREHYQDAGRRLRPGGLFVQWIPTYQVSEKEFGIIARTMASVFAQVTLWRGDLYPAQYVVALIGRNEAIAIDPRIPAAHIRRLTGNPDLPDDLIEPLFLRHYAGNITASRLFEDSLLNTDNHPIIEYLAPRTQRRVEAGRESWLAGDPIWQIYERIFRASGPAGDPALAGLDSALRPAAAFGRSYLDYNLEPLLRMHKEGLLSLYDFLSRSPGNDTPSELL